MNKNKDVKNLADDLLTRARDLPFGATNRWTLINAATHLYEAAEFMADTEANDDQQHPTTRRP